MSLTTSFNKNFLKENLKKSKGAVIFSLFVLPIITAVILIFAYKDSNSAEVLSWGRLSIFNFALMYLIPLAFTKILFGFVYKKNSSDFINSMPVNRKTIFVTNTIGGIALITLIQLLIAGVVWISSVVIPNLVIAPQAILDNFIIMLVTYIFIFIVSNLAMTISGNNNTQVAVTIFILFLVPFCLDLLEFIKIIDNGNSFLLLNGTTSFEVSTITVLKNYTMPYKFLRYIMYFESTFSVETVIRMIILSFVYYLIGLKLFQKRKMENCEESFGTDKAHLIFKTITLIPILLVLNLWETEMYSISYLTICVIFLAIYYIIYDFIIKRKIPFKTSVISFILSIIVVQTAITAVKFGTSSIDNNTLNIDDVSAVSFGEMHKNGKNIIILSSEYSDDTSELLDGDYFFKDDELIKWVFDALEESSENNAVMNDCYYSYNFQINFKTKTGKLYSVKSYISSSKIDDIYAKICSDDEYKETLKNKITKSGFILSNNNKISNKYYKKINEVLKNIDTEDLMDVIYNGSDSSEYTIKKYVYVNHKYEVYKIPISISEEIAEYIGNVENEITEEIFENDKNVSCGNFSIYFENNKYTFSNNNSNTLYKVKNFIENYCDEELDSSKPYAIISASLYDNNYYNDYKVNTLIFFTNRVDEVEDFISIIKNNTYNSY
jgi:ABC-2 type transport system permease protein